MVSKVQEYIKANSMIENGDRIVLGISGGADSVCLLMILLQMQKQYKLSLYVVHVNHGIREEAAEDAKYVKELCDQHGIPFFLFEEEVPVLAVKWGMSEEEAGRTCRYQCFRRVAVSVGAHKIATAHHMGDQAETVLFHLVRGTNLSGMAGVRPVTRLEGEESMSIIRPLLGVTKKEIIHYLEEHDMHWQEDRTNADNQYTRNRLRNLILPQLCEINAGAVEHIADFAECAAAQQAFFEKAVQSYMKKFVRESGITNREQLLAQEKLLAHAVIYEMIAQVLGGRRDITKEHVKAVYGLLGGQSGRKISLPGQTEAKIEYENLIIRKCSEVEEPSGWEIQAIHMHRAQTDKNDNTNQTPFSEKNREQYIFLPDGNILTIKIINKEEVSQLEWKNLLYEAVNSKNNYTKLFDCDTIKDTLYVRMPKKEDYFIINKAGNHKKLSRYFIDCKIPEEIRHKSIVVAKGSEVLWLVGRRRCENYMVNDNTKRILLLSCEGENDGEGY